MNAISDVGSWCPNLICFHSVTDSVFASYSSDSVFASYSSTGMTTDLYALSFMCMYTAVIQITVEAESLVALPKKLVASSY